MLKGGSLVFCLLVLPVLVSAGSISPFGGFANGEVVSATGLASIDFARLSSGDGTATRKIITWVVCQKGPTQAMSVTGSDARDNSTIDILSPQDWRPASENTTRSYFVFAFLINSGPGAVANLQFLVRPLQIEVYANLYIGSPIVAFRLSTKFYTVSGPTQLQNVSYSMTTALAGELVSAMVVATTSVTLIPGQFLQKTNIFGDVQADANGAAAGTAVTISATVQREWGITFVSLIPALETTAVTSPTTFVDDAVVSGSISATVTATKNLVVRESLTIASGVSVTVGETLIVDGQLTTNNAIAAKNIVLNGNSSFAPPVVTVAPTGSHIVFPIATYTGSVTGSFRSIRSVEVSFPTSDCFSFSQPAATASSGTLSVVVSVQTAPQCVGQTAAPAAGLSGGAIAGIVIGCSAAVAAIFVVVLITRKKSQRARDKRASVMLHAQQLSAVRAIEV